MLDINKRNKFTKTKNMISDKLIKLFTLSFIVTSTILNVLFIIYLYEILTWYIG